MFECQLSSMLGEPEVDIRYPYLYYFPIDEKIRV